MFKLVLDNEEKTKEIGYKLGKLLKKKDVLCLIGDLGAGKTMLTQSIARGLGIDEYVTSPTFSIIQEYDGDIPMYHFDVYRILDSQEMQDIGFDEYIYGEGICIIEWANIIEDILPSEYLHININYIESGREIEFIPKGKRYENIVEELIK